MKPGSLNPARLFFGPIFQMEVRTAGRRTSTYVFRFLFAGLVVFFFAVFLVGNWSSLGMQTSSVARLQQVQSLAPELATAIVWTQYPALLLLAPIIAGPALCDERRHRTLPALLTTPLTSWEIVLGKLSGRLTQALVLAAISVPVMLGARLLGGVSAEGILAASIVTAVSVIQIAALALLVSARSSRATAAASSAFVAFLFINFAPTLGVTLYNEWIAKDLALQPLSFAWMFRTSLPISLGAITVEHFAGQFLGAGPMTTWGWSSIYGGVVTILVVFTAGWRLRAAMRSDPDSVLLLRKVKPRRRRRRDAATGRPADPATPEALATSANTEPAPGLVEQSRASREVSDYPVFWREWRIGIFRRRRSMVYTFVGLVAIFTLVYLNADMTDAAIQYIVAEVGLTIMLLQAVFGSTGLIPHEREARTIDVLLTTPLKPRSIVFGKLAGAMRRLWLAPVCMMLHFLIVSLTGFVRPHILFILPLVMLPAALMLLGTGMLAGVLFRRPITAAVANLSVPISLYAVVPMMMALLQAQIWGWNDDSFERALTAILSIHPFAMVAVSVEGLSLYSWSQTRSSDPITFNMPFGEMQAVTYVIVEVIAGAIQIAIGLLAAGLAARWLPTREGRPN
ncbi:MAG: ABC transporter permease subunit [Phycisphaerales bacterium]|nr:ABC transporter permease subunit [Phycisphaerales bacterium]